MRRIKKILIGLSLMLMSLSASSQVLNPQIGELNWVNAKSVEKFNLVTIQPSQLENGDSIVIYKGQDAVLDAMYIRGIPYYGGFNTNGSTDTINIYATYNNNPVKIGYLSDTIVGNNIKLVHKASADIGNIDGDLFYLILPSGKFTDRVPDSDMKLDLICRWIIFK